MCIHTRVNNNSCSLNSSAAQADSSQLLKCPPVLSEGRLSLVSSWLVKTQFELVAFNCACTQGWPPCWPWLPSASVPGTRSPKWPTLQPWTGSLPSAMLLSFLPSLSLQQWTTSPRGAGPGMGRRLWKLSTLRYNLWGLWYSFKNWENVNFSIALNSRMLRVAATIDYFSNPVFWNQGRNASR